MNFWGNLIFLYLQLENASFLQLFDTYLEKKYTDKRFQRTILNV